jgi:competence protein ComEC
VSGGLRILAGGLLCLLSGWFLASSEPNVTRLSFLDVGQGDCSVIQHDGRTILVDAAPTVKAARYQVLPKLRQLGVRELDLVILTHPDADHIAGVPILARRFPDAKFAIPGAFRMHGEWTRQIAGWRLPASRILYLPEREAGHIGGLSIQLFCPPWSEGEDDNDGSAIVKLILGGATAVLSGDASAEAEAIAAASGDWSAQIMKAGHHGSRTSTSFAWLREVRPKLVVVSCGRGNRYGHPHPETLDRIQGAGSALARTDRGDVRFVLRNDRFELEEPR